jgi:ferric-dicitrate binding protein FerR (iron transport regulator)
MKNCDDKVWEIIAMNLSNEKVSESENQLFEDWKNQDDNNLHMYSILQGIKLSGEEDSQIFKDEILNLTYSKMFSSTQIIQKKRRSFFMMGIAASIAVLLTIGGFFLFNNSGADELTTVYCAAGELSKTVILPDKSEVILNSDSRLIYNENSFSNNQRKVSLEGEAIFTVTHDKEHPFTVNVNGASIKVLGTCFNVRSYSNEDQVLTTLINGSVEVESTKTIGSVRIKPNEQAILSRTKGNLEVVTVNVDDYVMWKEGWLQFQSLAFRDITRLLERRFNVKIAIQNNNLEDELFTGRFKQNEKLEDILKVIQVYGKFNYELKNNEYIIY